MQQYFQATLFLVLVVNSVLNVLWLKQEKQETKTAESKEENVYFAKWGLVVFNAIGTIRECMIRYARDLCKNAASQWPMRKRLFFVLWPRSIIRLYAKETISSNTTDIAIYFK